MAFHYKMGSGENTFSLKNKKVPRFFKLKGTLKRRIFNVFYPEHISQSSGLSIEQAKAASSNSFAVG